MSSCTTRTVKTRKPHRCAWCKERIQKGAECILGSGVEDNTHFRDHWHRECWEASESAPQETLAWWCDEGCIPIFQRGHTHEIDAAAPEALAAECPACRRIAMGDQLRRWHEQHGRDHRICYGVRPAVTRSEEV